ncbi:PaaI family thioesterase [Pseudonocardia hispaniensis]|uniref:PaaI family thioesterase n=1 Tax=Pseudonocardia hispaniensis TaxID=904933 RepID=A0ABW1J7P5_9PSEU
MTTDLTARMRAVMPFTAVLGASAVAAEPDRVRLRLNWDPTRCTAGGMLHGGALIGLADAAGGWNAFLNLPEGATGTATVDSTTHFLRGVSGGHVEATARPLHRGRTVIIIDTEVRDAAGRLVCRVTQTQAVLR